MRKEKGKYKSFPRRYAGATVRAAGVGVSALPVQAGLIGVAHVAAGKIMDSEKFGRMVAKELARSKIKGLTFNTVGMKDYAILFKTGGGFYNPALKTIGSVRRENIFLHELGHASNYGSNAFRRGALSALTTVPVALFSSATLGSYWYNSHILKKKKAGKKLTPFQKTAYKFTKFVEQNPVKVAFASYTPTLMDEAFASGRAIHRTARKYGPFSKKLGRAVLGMGSAGATYLITAAATGLAAKLFYNHFRKTSKYRFNDKSRVKKMIYMNPVSLVNLQKFLRSV